MKTRPHPHQPNLHQRTNFPGRIALAGVLCSLLGAAGLQAAVKTWDGSYSPYWSAAANWTGNVAPVDGDDLVFPSGAANLNNTNNAVTRLRSITFTGSGYVVRGTAITVTNGISGQQAAGANTVEFNVTLGAAQTFDCTTAGASQTLSGNVTNAGFMLTVSGSGTVMLHGSISGAGGLIKNGTGILDLGGSQANTYAGATFVNDGVVWLAGSAGGNGAIAGSALTIGDGVGAAYSAVVRPHGATWEQIPPMPITVNADGELDINSTTETIGTSLTLNDGNVDTAGGTLYLSPNSTITVSSTPTISGNLNVGSGTCTIQGTGYLYLYADVSGSASIVKNGSVSLLLYGANTFSGSLTANTGGYIYALNNLALGATNGGTIINDNSFLAMADVSITNEALTMNSSSSVAIQALGSDTNLWVGPVSLSRDTYVLVATNTVLDVIGPISGVGGITKYGPGTLRYSGAANNTYGGETVVNEGLLELNKSSGWAIGNGSLTIGDGTGGSHADIVRYTGTSGSEINVPVGITVNSSGLLDLNGHTDDVGAITLSGGDISTGAGTIQVSGDVNSVGSSRMAQISGHLYFYGGLRTITLADGAAFYDLRITAGITDAGAGLLITSSVPSDAWVQLLSSNNFSGPLTIANVTVDAEDNWSLGQTAGATTVASNGVLWVYFADIAGEPLTLNGGAQLVSQGLSSWGGQITLNGDATIRGFNGGLFDISGPITGTGNLSIWADGNGTLRLSGSQANTYVGSTLMRNGTLELAKTVFDGAIPSSLQVGDATHWATNRYLAQNQIGNSQTVTLYDGSLMDLNDFLDGIGTLNLYAARVETGTGYLAMLAPGRINVLSSTNGTAAINGSLKFDVDTTIDVQSSGPIVQLNVNANVFDSPASALTKAGPGAVSLNASNSYRGLTVVQDGFLWNKNAWGLGATNAGTIVSNSASLVLQGTFGVTNEALTLNGGGGGGSWGALDAETLGTNYWTGPITLNATSTIAPYQTSTALKVTGAMGGPGGLTQFGYGKLYFEGAEANTYAGATRLNQGTLVLNRSTWSVAVPADLIVGDGVGGADADVVRVMNNPQINDYATVTVNSSGLIDWSSDGGEAIGALAGSGHVELGAGSLYVGENNQSTTFSGLITGTGGGLEKDGSGIFTLTGDNTYTGLTYASQGTLLVNGSQPASRVQVASGATLGGTGTVGEILCNGKLRPGSSAGCLTSSNLTFTSAGSYYVELNGPTPCSGYDQMVVRGTNNLANATLNVSALFPPPDPVSIGDQFIIINNDGAEAVTGTFNGLPDGSEFSGGFYRFRINYGNDVILTAVGLPISGAATAVTSGNGNHVIDPNECNQLSLAITNQTGTPMTGVSAVLSASTANVMINQPYSAFADVPAYGNSTNTTSFQISTLPGLACGSDINLQLAVTTASHGSFVVPIALQSGSPSTTAARYDNNTITNVPDVGTIESTNTVAAWSGGPLTKIAVSLWLVAPWAADLNLTLIAPDGTAVDLSSGNGAGANFGQAPGDDANRTMFDDAAATSITAGTPPFVGTFRPEGSLASLLSSSAVGDWRLRIQDTAGYGTPDTLRGWSLFLYGTSCADGGGFCDTCPGVFSGTIGAGDLVLINRLYRDGTASSCGAVKTCPGPYYVGSPYRYDTYMFTNTGPDTCVTLALVTPSVNSLHASVYLNNFDPSDVCLNYLGDLGDSPPNLNSFSVNVPGGSKFVVVVNETSAGSGSNYQLVVTGLPCPQPMLAVDPLPSKVRLHWPTWAGGYQLDASTNAVPTAWNVVTNEPIVSGGRLNVTNDTPAPATKFYRLRKTQ